MSESCIKSIEVGDYLLIRLIQYMSLRGGATQNLFSKPILFPVIGRQFTGHPLIGTMDKLIYENARFITTCLFYSDPEISRWTYCMGINQPGTTILKIIKAKRKNALL